MERIRKNSLEDTGKTVYRPMKNVGEIASDAGLTSKAAITRKLL